MDLGINEKVALIVGADSGLGLATAKTLLEEGATVIITGIEQESLNQAVDSLGAPSNLHYYLVDVTKTDSLRALHQHIQQDVGKIDILVHSAGIAGTSGLFHEIDESDWQETLDVDLMGAVRTVKEFLPDLRTGGWGRLIIISSENAEEAYLDEIPYDCAKAGLLTLVKGLSKTYAKEGLLVNAVSPAFIETPMTDAMMEQRSKELNVSIEEAIQSFLDEKRPNIELKRRGKPEEVAAVIAFLCSDKASFINGSNYRVDAGSVSTI